MTFAKALLLMVIAAYLTELKLSAEIDQQNRFEDMFLLNIKTNIYFDNSFHSH